jgi:DNA-binding response OmpR family regulator
MPQVLVIEDDAPIRTMLIRALTERDFVVASAPNGMLGLAAVMNDRPDIVVLDLGLPDVDGLQVLRMLRGISQVPVIVATARDDDASVVDALDSGADDYVVKPFSSEQLEARLRAVLRRVGSGPAASSVLSIAGLRVDLGSRVATVDGRPLDLSPKEFDLLAYLAERPDKVITKRELLAEVWRQPFGGPDKTVDVHLSWLRRKMGETAQEPRYLHTVRGVGVKLVAPTVT